jgi:hypothetical protein
MGSPARVTPCYPLTKDLKNAMQVKCKNSPGKSTSCRLDGVMVSARLVMIDKMMKTLCIYDKGKG